MNAWDIYWADVPFDEDKSVIKRRPVLVINDKLAYVLSLKITSHEAREHDPLDYELVYWKEAGLNRKSTVRIGKLLKLEPTDFVEKIGTIHRHDKTNIKLLNEKYERYRRR